MNRLLKPFLVLINLIWLSTSCLGVPGIGDEPLHGMLKLSFSATAVCDSQELTLPFKSTTDQETVILGAVISGGTDPEGNFTLTSVKVGETEVKATSGSLENIHIPPFADYTFKVTYTPRSESETPHKALLDIAYQSPREGIIQVELTGASAARKPTCPVVSEVKGKKGSISLNGEMTIKITRIVLASSALKQAISTDPKNTVTPFEGVTLPIKLDSTAHTVLLPAIPESANFLLPATKSGQLSTLITGFTLVTSKADAIGTWQDDGSLTVKDLPIHLKEQFTVDFVVTLTTGSLGRGNFNEGKLREAGFTVAEDGKVIGSPINPDTFEVTLIGISNFTNPEGSGTIARSIGPSVTGAVIITATITPPKK